MLQIKARLYSIFVMGLCLILLVFVKINSCASYVQTWLGLGPMAAVETATLISNMYFYMPKSPDLKEPMIQVGPATRETADQSAIVLSSWILLMYQEIFLCFLAQ